MAFLGGIGGGGGGGPETDPLSIHLDGSTTPSANIGFGDNKIFDITDIELTFTTDPFEERIIGVPDDTNDGDFDYGSIVKIKAGGHLNGDTFTPPSITLYPADEQNGNTESIVIQLGNEGSDAFNGGELVIKDWDGTPKAIIDQAGNFVFTGTIQANSELRAGFGSVGDPSITFTGDADTGFRRSDVNEMRIVAGGSDIVELSSAGLQQVTGSYLANGGTVGSPGIRFSADTGNGIFRPGTDQFSIATGGVEALRINASAQLSLLRTATAAAGITTPTQINVPTAATGTQAGWIQLNLNGTTTWIPFWQ